MTNVNNLLELEEPPVFEVGNRVKITKVIRNDGTYPGAAVGERLVEKGAIGYVSGIGTYLQRAYVYSIHFLDTNMIVGCLSRELELAEENVPAN